MIHRFRVTNYKSLTDVSLDLSPITVLVGKSGTGKSNLVDSMRALRDAVNEGTRSELQRKWAQSRPAGTPNSPTRFEVDFSIPGVPEQFSYVIEISAPGPTNAKLKEESLHLGSHLLFSQEMGKWKTEPDLTSVPPPGPPALGRIPAITEVVIAFTTLSKGIGCYDFSDQVLTVKKNGSSAFGLDDHALNYLATLNQITSNLSDLRAKRNIVSALRQINPSVSSVELNDIQRPEHVLVGHEFSGKTLALHLNQESVGFRRFYAYLLALYQIPSKQTLIFEHPEDGVYPGALALLAEEFRSAPNAGRGQVILTTHSPDLLNNFNADEIRVVERSGFSTRVGLVAQEQRQALEDDLYAAGDLLNVDPARMAEEGSESPAS